MSITQAEKVINDAEIHQNSAISGKITTSKIPRKPSHTNAFYRIVHMDGDAPSPPKQENA